MSTSDLASDQSKDDASPKRASKEILRSEIDEGLDTLKRTSPSLFLSGLAAGLDVGFSVLLMAAMEARTRGHLSAPIVSILVANMYSVGFIFVVLGRSELFTEQTTLAVLPVLDRKSSVAELLRLWVVVYVANVLGGIMFAKIATVITARLGTAEPHEFGQIAHRMLDYPCGTIFLSALLAGWLMGLLSWLVAAGRDTISQIVIVWLITTCIGFAGLHHSVVGTVEVATGYFAGETKQLAPIGRFLLFATLGNIVGGSVCVALIKFAPRATASNEEEEDDDEDDDNDE